jgi:hypothetical protein
VVEVNSTCAASTGVVNSVPSSSASARSRAALARAQSRDDPVEQGLLHGAPISRRRLAQDLIHVVDQVRRRLKILEYELGRRGVPAG